MTLDCLVRRPTYEQMVPSLCSQEDTAGPSLALYLFLFTDCFITGQQDFLVGRLYEMPLPITPNTRTLTSLISLPVSLCSGLKPNLSKCGSTLSIAGRENTSPRLLFSFQLAHSRSLPVFVSCYLGYDGK